VGCNSAGTAKSRRRCRERDRAAAAPLKRRVSTARHTDSTPTASWLPGRATLRASAERHKNICARPLPRQYRTRAVTTCLSTGTSPTQAANAAGGSVGRSLRWPAQRTRSRAFRAPPQTLIRMQTFASTRPAPAAQQLGRPTAIRQLGPRLPARPRPSASSPAAAPRGRRALVCRAGKAAAGKAAGTAAAAAAPAAAAALLPWVQPVFVASTVYAGAIFLLVRSSSSGSGACSCGAWGPAPPASSPALQAAAPRRRCRRPWHTPAQARAPPTAAPATLLPRRWCWRRAGSGPGTWCAALGPTCRWRWHTLRCWWCPGSRTR
jgi:hypothetical protein